MKREKHTCYPGGFCKAYNHELVKEYRKKIGELDLGNITEENEQDVLNTLKKSLENGKSFYHNAPKYIQKVMEEYTELEEMGVLF